MNKKTIWITGGSTGIGKALAIKFSKEDTIESITTELNKVLELMIIKNPDQWIWTHNRWK